VRREKGMTSNCNTRSDVRKLTAHSRSRRNKVIDARTGKIYSASMKTLSKCPFGSPISSQVLGEEFKDEPKDLEVKDELISLLHLDNFSGMQGFLKAQSFDYDALQRYICCDEIPEETTSTRSSDEIETKTDDDLTC
jgi:hypothetical protein